MKYDKSFLRNKFLKQRRKKYFSAEKFNFNLIFNLIKKHFNKKKIIIAGYYPSNYEVDILNFLKESVKKNYKISLPVVKNSNKMVFKLWTYQEPLYVNNFGILEPKKFNRSLTPDLVLVPLVAFDQNLDRIGYGKGFYDRFLKDITKKKNKIISIGIAYSFQKVSKIPTNKFDFKLDYIFTERGIINSKK